MPADRHQGALSPEHSFLQAQPDNVVITAVKKAEDDNSLIVRFYEWAGTESDVKLQLPSGAVSAVETNLMEKPGANLPLQAGSVVVHTKPYEIKTVKVQFGSIPPAAATLPAR
jgi:alpha-mannosidase